MFWVKSIFMDKWCFGGINTLHGIFTDHIIIDKLFEILIRRHNDHLHIRVLFVLSRIGSNNIISLKPRYLEARNMKLCDDFLCVGNLSFEIRVGFRPIGFVIAIHIMAKCLTWRISCNDKIIWLVHKKFYHHTHKAIGDVDIESVAIGHIRESMVRPKQKTWSVEYVEFFHGVCVNNNCFGYTFLYSYYKFFTHRVVGVCKKYLSILPKTCLHLEKN